MLFQTEKKCFVVVEPQAAFDAASVTCNVIDTQSARFLEIFVIVGANNGAFTTLKLQESDVEASGTTLTGGADISQANGVYTGFGTVVGTDPNDTGSVSTLPTNAQQNFVIKFEIPLQGRKRYILPVITVAGTAVFITVLAELSFQENITGTAAGKNVSQLMRTP